MEEDIKQEFKAINVKLDTYIANQERVCQLHRKPLEEHIKDGPHFRDKIVKLGESLKINWAITFLVIGSIISGAVGGFFWMLRNLPK